MSKEPIEVPLPQPLDEKIEKVLKSMKFYVRVAPYYVGGYNGYVEFPVEYTNLVFDHCTQEITYYDFGQYVTCMDDENESKTDFLFDQPAHNLSGELAEGTVCYGWDYGHIDSYPHNKEEIIADCVDMLNSFADALATRSISTYDEELYHKTYNRYTGKPIIPKDE